MVPSDLSQGDRGDLQREDLGPGAVSGSGTRQRRPPHRQHGQSYDHR
jgi:hypothetical protein